MFSFQIVVTQGVLPTWQNDVFPDKGTGDLMAGSKSGLSLLWGQSLAAGESWSTNIYVVES